MASTKRYIIFILLTVSLLVVLVDLIYFKSRLYPGITLKNIDIQGVKQNELHTILNGSRVTFIGPEGLSTSIPLGELGVIVDSKNIFMTGYQQGRQSSWPFTYYERILLKREGALIPLHYHLDQKLLDQGLDSLVEYFNIEPVNAYFKILKNGEAELVPEKMGYQINKEELEQSLIRCLAQLNTPLTVEVPVQKMIPPGISVSLLKEKGIKDLVSSFSTRFKLEAVNRCHNIRLATSIINNYMLSPGDILSLNMTLGESTLEKGYKEAPIIVGGELVPGLGGGLFQISSTLYNAALLANLEIIERHNHQLTVPYIEPGRDATISYPSSDLKIRNNRNHSLLITATVEHDELTFNIFGICLNERVEIATKIIKTFEPPLKYEVNPNLAPGEKEIITGYPGYLVEVWKTVYKEGKVVDTKRISLDRYLPYPKIIRQGA